MLPALIMAMTIATSSTGGNYAGPGGVVHTGSEYSSSVVQTTVDGSGTTSVRIETNNNGDVRTIDRTIPDSQGANIEVETQASSSAATTSVRVTPVPQSTSTYRAPAAKTSSLRATATVSGAHAPSTATTIATTTATTSLVVPTPRSMVPPSLASRLMQAVASFIRSLFSFVP